MNNCPNCGLVRGFHNSILQGCTCQWQMMDTRVTFREIRDDEELRAAVAAEREACAKVCEDIFNDPKGNNGDDYYYTRPYLECAAAIRARGQE